MIGQPSRTFHQIMPVRSNLRLRHISTKYFIASACTDCDAKTKSSKSSGTDPNRMFT